MNRLLYLWTVEGDISCTRDQFLKFILSAFQVPRPLPFLTSEKRTTKN